MFKFVETTTEQLRGLEDIRNVRFKGFDNGKILPLFSFKGNFLNDTQLEEEKVIARQVIEKFLLRPLKNYHLAYQNHPITTTSNITTSTATTDTSITGCSITTKQK